MYENLKSVGISAPETIDRYSLRQEAGNDILKIYFQREKGEFFAKSVKLKFPRQRKKILNEQDGTASFKDVFEISPNLRAIVDELDSICHSAPQEVELKNKILSDLRHLEQVVSHKIAEIEADLEKLTMKEK